MIASNIEPATVGIFLSSSEAELCANPISETDNNASVVSAFASINSNSLICPLRSVAFVFVFPLTGFTENLPNVGCTKSIAFVVFNMMFRTVWNVSGNKLSQVSERARINPFRNSALTSKTIGLRPVFSIFAPGTLGFLCWTISLEN